MNNQIQSDFDTHWENNFSDSIPRIKIQEAEIFLAPVIPLLRSKELKVFEAGCGDGVHWTFISGLKNDRLNYSGIDISATAINRLEQQKKSPKHRFLKMDLTELSEPKNFYDAVFAFHRIFTDQIQNGSD